MTVTDYIDSVAERFRQAELHFGHGTDNAFDEAVYLVYASLLLDFSQDYSLQKQELQAEQLDLLDQRVNRRINEREPVAYIVGEAWYCGIPFACDKRALIPRSPIAELINSSFQPLCKRQPRRILDLCAGGGCIGISCAIQFDEARVDLADISAEALSLAQENIIRHGTSGRVQTIQSDLFDKIEDRYDLIVANPPYVSGEEVASLPAEFGHEPRLGLESARSGLEIPVRILQQAGAYLHREGLLIMEVGYSAERLQSSFPTVPLLWLQFEQGGEGVMALTAEQLSVFQEQFSEGSE